MWLLRPVVALISLCAVSTALHEADVGLVDWHKQLIGVPLAGPLSASPSFHHVENRSLIITTTDSNVLAALEPEDGSIRELPFLSNTFIIGLTSPVWRHVFDPEDRIMGYYKNSSGKCHFNRPLLYTHIFLVVIATLSEAGGATLRTFNAISGEIVLEKKLNPSETRALNDPIHVGKDVIFSRSSADIYVLTNGHIVSVLDGETGELKLRWASPDQG